MWIRSTSPKLKRPAKQSLQTSDDANWILQIRKSCDRLLETRDEQTFIDTGLKCSISRHASSIRFIFCPTSPTLRITNPTSPMLFVLDYRDSRIAVSGSINLRVSITSFTSLKPSISTPMCPGRSIKDPINSYLLNSIKFHYKYNILLQR